MIDQVTLFAAAARGDVTTIERFFRQPSQFASLVRTNRWVSERYWYYLPRNMTPFVGGLYARTDFWYVLCRATGGPPYEQFFDAPATNGHLAVAEWFCGVDASRIFGEAIRPMLGLIYETFTRLNQELSELLTEMMISSHAVQTMSDREQAAVLKMMLSDAIGNNRPDIVRMLVTHGAICDDPSMMMMAAGYGDEATFHAMLDSGLAYITHRVLNQTIDCSNYDATRFMLRHGMDAQADSGELGPLHTAAQEEYEEDFLDSVRTVHFLVTEGFADVNAQCSKGMTPLMCAVSKPPSSLRCDKLDILTTLLQYGAYLEMRDKEGETALHKAHPETLLPLLMHGANPNAQDHCGSTVLHKLAEQTGNEDNTAQMDVVLSFQADPYITNENGVSPYLILMQYERGQSYIRSRAHYFA